MQRQNNSRPTSGTKAIALDNRLLMLRYRLNLLLTLIFGAGVAIGLRLIFGK